MSTDNFIGKKTETTMTNKNPSPLTRFQLGNREGGRTKGARNRITDRFLEVFGADFDDHADTVIATVRAEDPTSYLRIVAHLLPKELEARLQVEQRAPGNLDPGEWATLRRVLDLIEAAGASGFPPEQVFQLIEHTLRAEMASRLKPHQPSLLWLLIAIQSGSPIRCLRRHWLTARWKSRVESVLELGRSKHRKSNSCTD